MGGSGNSAMGQTLLVTELRRRFMRWSPTRNSGGLHQEPAETKPQSRSTKNTIWLTPPSRKGNAPSKCSFNYDFGLG